MTKPAADFSATGLLHCRYDLERYMPVSDKQSSSCRDEQCAAMTQLKRTRRDSTNRASLTIQESNGTGHTGHRLAVPASICLSGH